MTSLATVIALPIILILNWPLGGLLSMHVLTSRICKLKHIGALNILTLSLISCPVG
jgi:hypothetical protein